jgi:hypothetical protein
MRQTADRENRMKILYVEMDVEASRAIRQAEVGAAKAMIERFFNKAARQSAANCSSV